MAYQVDYSTGVITIPQSDLIYLEPGKYKLDLNTFRKKCRDLEDDFVGGLSYSHMVDYNTAVDTGDVILARVVLIVNGYSVTFEDGQYAVLFDGANTNVHNYTNVNQVSIRPNNSTGLQDLSTLLASAYGGKVVVNINRGQPGTGVPIGTLSTPSNNTEDAITICTTNGIGSLFFQSDVILAENLSRLRVIGESHVLTHIEVAYDAICGHTVFDNIDIEGILDGDSEIVNCVVRDIVYFNGHIHHSALAGRIILGGNKPAKITECSMLEFGSPVIIDCGGSGQDAVIDRYNGGITIDNLTGANSIGLGMGGGMVTINDTCTAGTIIIQGNFELTDNSGDGCTVIINEKLIVQNDILTIAETVWLNGTRELTQSIFNSNIIEVNGILVNNIDDFKADISDFNGDVNIVEVNGVAVTSIDEFKANLDELDTDFTIITDGIDELPARVLDEMSP